MRTPPGDTVRVNVDVGVRDNFAVAATIIRDHHGAICGFKVAKLDVVDPLNGEAGAAKLGVQFAQQQGFS